MDEKKRIIEFDAAESVPVDGQLPIDSASQGTKKITPALLLKAITDLLGDEALDTLAQTLTGAVNEVKGIADDAQDLAENISDEYSSTSAYAKGDYCIHNNTLYKCTTAIGSGGEAWNASHWSATKCDDELSELKQSLEFKAGDTYTINFVGGYTLVPARLGWNRARCIATFPMPKPIPNNLNVNATSIPTSGTIYLNDGTSYGFTNAAVYSVWKHRNMLTLIFTFTPSASLSGTDIGANVEFTTGDLTLSFS